MTYDGQKTANKKWNPLTRCDCWTKKISYQIKKDNKKEIEHKKNEIKLNCANDNRANPKFLQAKKVAILD